MYNLDVSYNEFNKMNNPRFDLSTKYLEYARDGKLEKMLELLDNALVEIDASNANGLNCLHLCCKEGHLHIVNELLARNMPVDKPTKKGNTPLHIACMAGHEGVVKVLVQSGADVNSQSQIGFTPLYMASQENHVNVARYLLNHGALQSIATEDGFTPLSVALQQGNDQVVKLLMEEDPKIKVKLPVLHTIAKKDDLQAATLLILRPHHHSNKSDLSGVEENTKDGLPDVNETTKSGFTPLHISSHYGSTKVAKLLLQNGAEVNFKAKNSITPLHVACKWGKEEMVRLLLDYDADIEAKTRDSLTPLHCSCRGGHLDVVQLLVERGAHVHNKTKSGLTPLHMAAQGDHVTCAEFLLTKGALIDDVTLDFLTPLHVASHCGNLRVAKFLLDDRCQVNAKAMNGFTPLHVACKKNRVKVVELLVKMGADIFALTESSLTPLHISCFMGHISLVTYLLEKGADPEVTNIRGETPLHLASRANQLEVMKILIGRGVNTDAQAKEGQTPLHICSRLGSLEGVELLLNSGSQKDPLTKDSYTPLHISVKEAHDLVVAKLLEEGVQRDVLTKKGFTPLHIVAKYGSLSTAKLLLDHGSQVDAYGKNSLTPLHVSIHYNNLDVATLLLDWGANSQAPAKNGYTPLHIAAKRNMVQGASLLLSRGAKPDSQSKNGFTPLHLASQEGHDEMCHLLLSSGAPSSSRSSNDLTPIHLSAQEDHVGVAKILVEFKTPLDPQTKAGYTPLHTACHFGQLNMVRFLLSLGADTKKITKTGMTPLHQAAQQGHVLVVNDLLSHKADPDILNNDGQTALSIADHNNYISIVEALKPVTMVSSKQWATYEKFSPEIMQEMPIESDDDNEKSYHYLNVDDRKEMRYNTSSPEEKDLNDSRSGIHSNYSFRTLKENQTPQGTLEKRKEKEDEEDGEGDWVSSGETKSKPASEEDFLYEVNNKTAKPIQENFKTYESSFSQKSSSEAKEPPPLPLSSPPSDQFDFMPKVLIQSEEREEYPELFQTRLADPNPPLSPLYPPSDSSPLDYHPDNISIDKLGIHSGFLVSFVVDARGGAMNGCRHSGVRLVVPPFAVDQPTRITCKLVAKEKLVAPLPLNDGESLATRILQMGPEGFHFASPVLIELPHFCSLRKGERELLILRSDDSRVWREQSLAANGHLADKILKDCNFSGEDLEPAEILYNNKQIARIITSDFPRFLAIISRFSYQTSLLDSRGGVISSRVDPLVQGVLQKDSILNKSICVSLQVMPVDNNLATTVSNGSLITSSVVTIEPRHRKFHRPIIITIPLPVESCLKNNAFKKQENLDKLKLYCSMNGGTSAAQWEEVEGHTFQFTNDCVSFTTDISARFWLVELKTSMNREDTTKEINKIYKEINKCPFLTKAVVYAKRKTINEAKIRVFCTTDDKLEKNFEIKQNFSEVARGKSVEVFEGSTINMAVIGNLLVSKQLKQQTSDQKPNNQRPNKLSTVFKPLKTNRLESNLCLKDFKMEAQGQLLLLPSFPRFVANKLGHCVNPICALNLSLPVSFYPEPEDEQEQIKLDETYLRSIAAEEKFSKVEIKLTDIAGQLQSDWVSLAREMGFNQQGIVDVQRGFVGVEEQALVVLHKWMEKNEGEVSGNELERLLEKIGRKDIIEKCMRGGIEMELENQMEKMKAEKAVGKSEIGSYNGYANKKIGEKKEEDEEEDEDEGQKAIKQFMRGSQG